MKKYMMTCLTMNVPTKKYYAQQQTTRKQGFGALLTINIIFEVQFFVGGLVVKIPACV